MSKLLSSSYNNSHTNEILTTVGFLVSTNSYSAEVNTKLVLYMHVCAWPKTFQCSRSTYISPVPAAVCAAIQCSKLVVMSFVGGNSWKFVDLLKKKKRRWNA